MAFYHQFHWIRRRVWFNWSISSTMWVEIEMIFLPFFFFLCAGYLSTCWSYALWRWNCHYFSGVIMHYAFHPCWWYRGLWQWKGRKKLFAHDKDPCLSDPRISSSDVGRSSLLLEAWDKSQARIPDMGRAGNWSEEENLYNTEEALQNWVVSSFLHPFAHFRDYQFHNCIPKCLFVCNPNFKSAETRVWDFELHTSIKTKMTKPHSYCRRENWSFQMLPALETRWTQGGEPICHCKIGGKTQMDMLGAM